MIFVVCATKSEAQAVVEKFGLQKEGSFFTNKNIVVSVSGVGVQNSKKAAVNLLESFDTCGDDLFLNIGICAGDNSYKIGELVRIGTVVYDGVRIEFDQNNAMITSVDAELSSPQDGLFDMEAFGFCEALEGKKNYKIFKIVSDHFAPQQLTKDAVKKMVAHRLGEIFE